MNTENSDDIRNGSGWSRWLRVGLLTFSMAGPVITTFLNQMRKRSQTLREQAEGLPTAARAVQTSTLQRLDELTLTSREQAVAQAQQLRKQAQQLRSQAKQLRKALRAEAKQRQKIKQLQKQLQKSGMALGQDWLKRGSKLSHNVAERSGQMLEPIIEPMRKRDSRFWTVFGFTTGLFAAAIVTYVLVRRRVTAINSDFDSDEQIELPHNGLWKGSSLSRPSGEIRHVNSEGTSVTRVATVAGINVEDAPQETTTEQLEAIQTAQLTQMQTPTDVAFVGVVSTKLYYPTSTKPEANDVIYFASEDEAKAEGFIPAPTE